MTFEEKTIAILDKLQFLPERRGEIKQLMQECEIDYIDNDISEFRRYFNQTNYVETLDISAGRMIITLNQIGLDYLNSYSQIKESQRKENEIKEFQYIEMKKKVEILETQIKEQSEFWTTTAQKNKEQLWTIWLALIISSVSLVVAIFK